MTLSSRNAGKELAEIAGYALFPALILSLNLILKWIHLDTVQIGMDEPFTIFHAQLPPAEIAEALKIGNNPPLMEVLLHYWMKVFGDSPASMRFPSMLAASFAGVALFHLGWQVRNIWTGLLAALAYTFSTEHTYYAHEARVYAIFSLLSLLSVLLLLQLREQPGSGLRWGLLLLVNALMIWGHYFGFIVLGFEGIWILLAQHPEKRKLLLRYVLLSLATLVLYLPHLVLLVDRIGVASGAHWVGPSSLSGIYNTIAKHANQPVVAVGMLAVCAFGAAWGIRNPDRSRAAKGRVKLDASLALVLMFFPGGILLLYGLGKFLPVFLERYAIFSMVFFYLAMALAVNALPGGMKRWIVGIALVLGLAFTVRLAPDFKSQWKEVSEFLQQERHEGEPLLISPRWCRLSMSYHYRQDIFGDPHQYERRMAEAMIFGVMKHTPLDTLPLLGAARIWIVSAGDAHADLHPSVQRHLDTAYTIAHHRADWHGITIKDYVAR